MRRVKQNFGYLALAALAVLACLELVHWGDRRIDLVSENTAMNLRQTSAASITEEERTMMETLFEVPAIQELLESEEGGDVTAADDPAVMAIVEDCLGSENADAASAVVLPYKEGPALVLDWSTDKERTMLQKTGTEYYKVYSKDGLLGTRSIYENWDNERVRQSVAHHWWFSWLTANW